MRRIFKNKLGIVDVTLLAGLALTASLLSGPTTNVATGPSLPPEPWEQVQVATGPSLPPEPWEQIRHTA